MNHIMNFKNIERNIMKLSVLRNVFLVLFLFGSLVFSLSSCTLETSNNGHFDGYWHLERVDTLATGGWCDYSKRRIFWGVQFKLLSCNDADVGPRGCYFRFEQTGDSLFLGKAYKNNWHQDNGENGGDIPVDDVEVLRYYGVNELEEHFAKEALSGSKMVLRSKTLRLKFRKF